MGLPGLGDTRSYTSARSSPIRPLLPHAGVRVPPERISLDKSGSYARVLSRLHDSCRGASSQWNWRCGIVHELARPFCRYATEKLVLLIPARALQAMHLRGARTGGP